METNDFRMDSLGHRPVLKRFDREKKKLVAKLYGWVGPENFGLGSGSGWNWVGLGPGLGQVRALYLGLRLFQD
jgi:hypothetical protein